MLSLLDTTFLRSVPHRAQRCTRTYSDAPSTPIGSMSPRHFSKRSPGCISTCALQRHFGQWFVYPLPSTRAPQCAQVKSSFLFWKRAVFFIVQDTLEQDGNDGVGTFHDSTFDDKRFSLTGRESRGDRAWLQRCYDGFVFGKQCHLPGRTGYSSRECRSIESGARYGRDDELKCFCI